MKKRITYTNKELVEKLKWQVEASRQIDIAEKYDVKPQYICDVIKGRAPFSEKLANAMGFTKGYFRED